MALVHDAARSYCAQGFRVVPLYGVQGGLCLCGKQACKPRDGGKHTDENEDVWKDGGSYSQAEFDRQNNIAVAMGSQRHAKHWLVALDFDGPGFPVAELLGALPNTLAQHTPRGTHLIFKVAAYEPLGNWVDVFRTKPGASLDLRYARGRIVVEPSKGITGSYKWAHPGGWLKLPEPAWLPQHALDAIYSQRRDLGFKVDVRWSRDGKSC